MRPNRCATGKTTAQQSQQAPRLSPSLSFLLLRGEFKRRNVVPQSAKWTQTKWSPRKDTAFCSFFYATSFQRLNWPQIKLYTISEARFWLKFLCHFTWCEVWTVLLRVLRSFKNHQMEVSNWRISTSRRWFFELTLATKWVTPHERACKTGPENGFFACVPFS